MVSRRQVLSLSGAGLLSLQGCLSVPHPAPKVKIPWIQLVNERSTESSVHLRIKNGEKRVFDSTYRLSPVDTDGAQISIRTPVQDAGRYVIQGTLGDEKATVDVTEFTFGDQKCVGVRLVVSSGSLEQWHYSTEEC